MCDIIHVYCNALYFCMKFLSFFHLHLKYPSIHEVQAYLKTNGVVSDTRQCISQVPDTQTADTTVRANSIGRTEFKVK